MMNVKAKRTPVLSQPARTVQPIHFEDFTGNQFERLVFAFHARTDRWLSLEWFGQCGKDKGRDILGTRESDLTPDGETVCVLCANWQNLTAAKVIGDINKVLKSCAKQLPTSIRVVCGHDISAGIRDKVKAHATANGIYHCELWSGKEFEEMIRANAESLLARFVHGEAFPDIANDLLHFAWGAVPVNDDERLALITLAFRRPAFTTPIHMESSLPAFKKAINDTIKVLGTGIWQTRENEVIRRLPMASEVDDADARRALADALDNLVTLRTVFDNFVRCGAIKHCGCGDADCPTFMVRPDAAERLTHAREEVLNAMRRAYPAFSATEL
jgi:hypothetical protein